jgi:DNA end-binding protein Ku
LVDLINQKRNGMTPTAKATPKSAGNVISLMDALKRSLANEKQSTPEAAAKPKKSRKRIDGQREMLLPISGKREAKEEAKAPPRKAEKPARTPARSKKAG